MSSFEFFHQTSWYPESIQFADPNSSWAVLCCYFGQLKCSGRMLNSDSSVFHNQFLHSCCVHNSPWCAKSTCPIIIMDIHSTIFELCIIFNMLHSRYAIAPTRLSIGGEFKWKKICFAHITTIRNSSQNLISNVVATGHYLIPWTASDWPTLASSVTATEKCYLLLKNNMRH
jgi:hypothetical protein